MPNANGRRKSFSRVIADDQSVLARVRFVGDDNAAGTAVTAATVQVAADALSFRINASLEGIGDYTGASTAAGVLTFADGNANSIQETLDIINGIGTGQAVNRRWRAAQGDLPLLHPLDGTTGLVTAAANALLGHRSAGLSLFADRSAVTTGAAGGDVWLGIGTERGVLPGGGLKVPDYFEDFPGTSGISGFSSNTPDRSRQRAKQNDEAVFVAVYTPVITYIAFNMDYTGNDVAITIWDNSLTPGTDTPLFTETLGDTGVGAGPVSAIYNGRADGGEFRGTPGEPLFVRATGTTFSADEGGLVVNGYYELSLNRAA